jgi:histidinol-phosphate aminotransferase
MTITSIGRPSYRALSLYAPDRTPCRIDLSDNTNLWGMPPASRVAIAAETTARYPSLYANDLKKALAGYTGLPADMITTGCGSDDVLDSAMRAFTEPGDRIAFSMPTFPMIPIFARMNGLAPVDIGSSDARLTYVCSQNNPTGGVTSRARIEELLKRTSDGQVVILDEAYAEFAGESLADLVRDYDRLLVTRTMSKAFGLAGLRVGYALGAPQLVAEVEKSRGPYTVSAIAERAAVAALTTGLPWVREHIALAIDNRARLALAFMRRGVLPLPSAANFVFVPLLGAAAIARAMRDLGVAVRAFDDPEGLRVSVGPWPVMLEALAAFDEARRQCA